MAAAPADWAAAAEAELADLERTWAALDIPGHRTELLDGQLIVSPSPSRRHSRAIDRLIVSLVDVRLRNDWEFHTNLTVHITASRERLIPDLMIAPKDAPGFGDSELLSSGVLLAAEVVSPHSQQRDRVTKLRAYARGGVPLYLLIDQLTSPATVTLFSSPGQDRYTTRTSAAAGQQLPLPEPFAITLNAARLLG